jgi:hypothetical protein
MARVRELFDGEQAIIFERDVEERKLIRHVQRRSKRDESSGRRRIHVGKRRGQKP